MGAWAVGNFENDDALDWVSDIVESSGIEKLLFPINSVLSNQEYLESPICSEALVSIEIISAYKNAEFSNIPEEVNIWLSTKKGLLFGKKPEFTSTHIKLAKQALEKIISSSELKELWQDSEHFEEWCSIQNKLVQSLENA